MLSTDLPAFATAHADRDDTCGRALVELAAALPTPDGAEAFCRELEPEYVRLFVSSLGGVAAPPYHSCHPAPHSGGEARMMGPPARRMAERLRASGLDTDPGGPPPDHLCVELEYLSLLLESGSGESAAEARALAGEMLDWTSRFGRAVAKADAHPFYSSACLLLSACLDAVATLPPAATQPLKPTG